MKKEQRVWTESNGWDAKLGELGGVAQLVFVFGGVEVMRSHPALESVRQSYPKAYVVGCSTAGEIAGTEVKNDSLVLTALAFESSTVKAAVIAVEDPKESRAVARELYAKLDSQDLKHVIVLSEGLCINGSELVQGLVESMPAGVTLSGGLSGDGDRFQETFVLLDESCRSKQVVAIGLYGDNIAVRCASLGGWNQFGPGRRITKAEGNVLYELDGKSALELYKEYLGEHAAGLPATGLLFPLSIRTDSDENPIVRTILGVNEDSQSIVFAGDMPEGAVAQLMRANFDRLVDGAIGAAKATCIEEFDCDFALLISCVGRKMVLKQRVEEEVEGVQEILGEQATLAGFYSYGEISPFTPGAKCQLHNQTMTITAISEKSEPE
jgi:hypothetical protein